jgi:hypothetical protein
MENQDNINMNGPEPEPEVTDAPLIEPPQQLIPDEIQRMLDWSSGRWNPNSKQEEDDFLNQSADYLGINCRKNPGKLGEWVVNHVLGGNLPTNQRISCNWLGQQQCICPDLGPINNKVYEIKTLRYFNSNGGRGNQGTSSEKIDSIFRKYWNIPQQKIIVFVGDQQFEKNGQIYLDAFNNNNFNSSGYMETLTPIFKENGFVVVAFSDLLLFENNNN